MGSKDQIMTKGLKDQTINKLAQGLTPLNLESPHMPPVFTVVVTDFGLASPGLADTTNQCCGGAIGGEFEEEDTYSASRLCPECGRKYGTATGLRKHVQSHTRVFKYVCSICSKGFTEKHQLSAHMTKHGHPKLSCDQCKRTFTRPFSLQRHLLTCNNEKGKDDRKVSFACQVCDKTFGQKGTLTTHMEGIHMGLVKYSCELCDKKYKWRTSLSLHVQSKH